MSKIKVVDGIVRDNDLMCVSVYVKGADEKDKKRVCKFNLEEHTTNIADEPNSFLCDNCHFGDFGALKGYIPKFCPNCGMRIINHDNPYSIGYDVNVDIGD